MSSMSKGDGIDGRARRWSYAGRLEVRLWDPYSLHRCRAAPRTCLPACLAKHRPLNAACSLLSWNPAGDFHALDAASVSPEFVLDSKRAIHNSGTIPSK